MVKNLMTMPPLDPHLIALMSSSLSTHLLSHVLPRGDIEDELRSITAGQLEIITTFLEGKHYGTNHLSQFTAYAESLKQEAIRLLRFKQSQGDET